MRRIYITILTIILFLAGLNIYIYSVVNKSQQQQQRELLLDQARLCGSHIENTFSEYESDLNRIIYNNANKLPSVFTSPQVMKEIKRDLESFYAKYRKLITNISVYNDKNRYLGIYINDKDEFVVDTFARQQTNRLEPKDIITYNKGYYQSYFPFFADDTLRGNIIVEISFEDYIQYVFNLYHVDDFQWQWLISEEGELLLTNGDPEGMISGSGYISESVRNDEEGTLKHHALIQGKEELIISAYYPLDILQGDIGLVFSLESGLLRRTFLSKNILLSVLTFIIFLGLTGWLVYLIRKGAESDKDLKEKNLRLRMIIEHFPTGIIILDKAGIIQSINKNGQKMLLADNEYELTGKNIDEIFHLPDEHVLSDIGGNFAGRSNFIHYLKDGSEVVIYKQDHEIRIAGEEMTVTALVDVSPMEKSRKKEAAANRAKSDFLAKMSHEIRTPMNGIIGMTDDLLRNGLAKGDKESVMIIRKSSELLMNIINDILDFSKIEAGKMMLEEIPFSISEDIGICIELFRPLAREKGLKLYSVIDPEVPDRLIGDPFRLRQVISNLLSNAVKFTTEGEIKVSIELVEKSGTGLMLLIVVEDSGIGIPKEDIPKIFGQYQQATGSTSRKYGGTGLGTTISKQLVEMMNGEIWIESPSSLSQKDEYPGSRFCFTVELFSDEKLRKNFDFSHISHYREITALILSRSRDEEDSIHKVLSSFGISYNYRIYDNNTIDSVVYHIEQKKDLYQLIILKDKPDNDGFAMALQLKENHISKNYPVIMVSSNNKRGNYRKARSLGVDHYLIKPYETNEVFDLLRENFPAIREEKSITPYLHKIRTGLDILVAEDNIINQRVIQTIFKHIGYEIDIAGNGKEALEMHKSRHYDMILMDLLMPEMDGMTACQELRRQKDYVPVIAMTAGDDDQYKEEAFSAGMNEFVTKPVKLETIKQLLIKWFSESI